MYKVFFESVAVYKTLSVEDAVGFALGLHRQSNLPHKIGVIEIGNLKPTIVFERSAKTKDEDEVSS